MRFRERILLYHLNWIYLRALRRQMESKFLRKTSPMGMDLAGVKDSTKFCSISDFSLTQVVFLPPKVQFPMLTVHEVGKELLIHFHTLNDIMKS
jgi:hypothetical protein